jgi:hypothetical protein
MTKSIVSSAHARLVEQILKDDVLWSVKYGPGFNTDVGAKKNGKWHSSDTSTCGVCAVAAHCIREQPPLPSSRGEKAEEVFAAAKSLKVPYDWLLSIYAGITGNPWRFGFNTEEINKHPDAVKIAGRLSQYGKSLSKKAEELRHQAGMEDQLLAKRLKLTK